MTRKASYWEIISWIEIKWFDNACRSVWYALHETSCLTSPSELKLQTGEMGLLNYGNALSLFAHVSMATLTKTQQQMAVARLSGLNWLSLPPYLAHYSSTQIYVSTFYITIAKRLRSAGPEVSLRRWYTDLLDINRGNNPQVTFIVDSSVVEYNTLKKRLLSISSVMQLCVRGCV